MIKLYRLMCEAEYNKIDSANPFTWLKRCKWLTDTPAFLTRVGDSRFNNSNVCADRYTHLVIYCVESLDAFKRVSAHELMLYRRDEPKVKVHSITKLTNFNLRSL